MVGVKARMSHLRTRLALIRSGAGAAILPQNVRRLVVMFAMKNKDGHMGPRKFWRNYLPRLKYHNPGVEMEVSREGSVGGPAMLRIEFDGDRQEEIDVQNKHENDIVKSILDITKAKPVPTSEEDALLVEQYEMNKARRDEREITNKRRRAARKVEKGGIMGIPRPA